MQPGKFDHIFQVKLDSWTSFQHRFHQLFSQREIDSIQRAQRTFNKNNRTVVYLSFENRFASLGGLAAVSRLLPPMLKKCNEQIVCLTPFHSGCAAVKEALRAGVLTKVLSEMVVHLCNYECVLNCYKDSTSEIPVYFLQIEGRFNAGENPYGYENKTELLYDALAFSAAVPLVLSKLGYDHDLILHANDWETAPVAITSKFAIVSNVLKNARTLLTLHNSFDSGISREDKLTFFGLDFPGHTILQCSLPWLNGPLTTVSSPFALELSGDSIQYGFFTDHLQHEFAMNPPIGIENGMFGDATCTYTQACIRKAHKGDFQAVLERKNSFRKQFISILEKNNVPESIGRIDCDGIDSNIPIFFMSGRLDMMQKGFDVIFQAFERLERGSAKLFFCPSSVSSDLEYFRKSAERCKGDIAIWPFRIPLQQYTKCIAGATFLVMPSLYEPFGAATEAYIQGTPVIARGTGGLWIQVEPWNDCVVPAFYNSVVNKKEPDSKPTGILYRETIDDAVAAKLWRPLLESTLQERFSNPLYKSIVSAAEGALRSAIGLYQNDKAYAEVIVNGIDMLKYFSWDGPAKKYRKIYDTASVRGF
ncbi:MAG TPA: glycogen/starch synthase [Chitinispirillaceae bacterium]|nr:glycogen/starch synthase [Chitinispirillaceae bacterium]